MLTSQRIRSHWLRCLVTRNIPGKRPILVLEIFIALCALLGELKALLGCEINYGTPCRLHGITVSEAIQCC